MRHQGAGGTDGGTGLFLLSLVMMIGGGYLLLSNMIVRPDFGMGLRGVTLWGTSVPTGMLFIPFLFGIGLIFYNGRNWIGWLLAGGALVALVFGVLSSLHIQMARLNAFELIVILILLIGGIGLFARSLFPMRRRDAGRA